MPNPSRDKGSRFEREVVRILQEHGLAAERVPLSGSAGGSYLDDITVPVKGQDKRMECKCRKGGFKTLYGYMRSNYGVVVKDDRCPPLVVIRLDDFARLAVMP